MDPGKRKKSAGPSLPEARLQAVLKLFPAIQLFSLVDALLLSWYFWVDVNPLFFVCWTSAVALHGMGGWFFARWAREHWQWLILHASLESLLFSLFIVVVFPVIPAEKAVVLAAFVTGLLAAGSLSKMSIRPAAYSFIVVLTLGAGIGFWISPLPAPWIPEFLLVGFALALASLVSGMSRVFDARVEAEHELGRQKTLVSDLLDDFGESTNDGLWETDAHGRLTMATPRLAALLGAEVPELTGKRLLEEPQWAILADRGTSFRDVEVPIDTATGSRWWAMTGKPQRESGQVVGWRGVAYDVTERRQHELEMLRVSRFDSLTGLLNRRSFRTMLDELFSPGSTPVQRCLVLIDLVDFKDVNESRGHVFGDALLVAVAARLRSSAPEPLVLARLDGDEFALQGAVSETVEATMTKLNQLMKHLMTPFLVAGERIEVGFRFGLSFTPDHASSPDQWLRCADLALRTAKSTRHHRIQTYDPAMMTSFVEKSSLRASLREALGRGEVHLEYQAIVGLSIERITGFEALVRWSHPTRGDIPPSVFIPLAEETAIILELGLWVLETACRTALGWPESVSLSVNVSGVQLRSGTLVDDVATILARVGFDPHRLVLEVTESALVRDEGDLVQTFEVLKQRGIRWALDDFGTGYSSLSYLQDFPFDTLKIDQSFVRPRASREPSPALLESIVSLAQALGLTTTAEGIEDETHRKLLRSLGCDRGQGYLFSRPVTADQVPFVLQKLS